MNIRKTRKEDLPQVMEIIRMAQQSFREQGINQWQDGYPNEAIILQDMEKKQSYVAQEKELLVGTAVISMEKEILDHVWNLENITKNRNHYLLWSKSSDMLWTKAAVSGILLPIHGTNFIRKLSILH